MIECEYFTDELGTKFPKRVKSNEIRILVDKSSCSVNFCYPSNFTSEERKSRPADLEVISTEIEKISSFISSQILGKPLSTSLVVKIGSSIEGILNKVLSKLINQDYKVTYWIQEREQMKAIENTDIHKLTASRVFNVPYNKVTDEQRRIAKTLNFKELYKWTTHQSK